MSMFCYQCEQAAKGTGCTKSGVCGKTPEVANLLELLVYQTKGISQYAHRARKLGAKTPEADTFVVEALFTSVTNVDFDPARLDVLIEQAAALRNATRAIYEQACAAAGQEPEILSGPAGCNPPSTREERVALGEAISLAHRLQVGDATIVGLQELLLYGLKGMASYADHAHLLGYENEKIYGFTHEAMDFLTTPSPTVDELLGFSLKCGEVNLTTMELLDQAHNDTFGHPEPTSVRITAVKGKAILVSGHDLKDLKALLEQTEGLGINIYTHGEMLPANAYPELKKHKHLIGNYGGAWQDQAKEFDAFPGAILMTTNCIQRPRPTYINRIFTTGLVGWPNVVHTPNQQFGPVIEAALAAPGFTEDEEEKHITIGFAHHAVLQVADVVIDAVKQGKIRHFFLIGGCDGAESGRNYYTKIAEQVPEDCVILTLACGKFRFNKLEFGDIGGIPRLLDMGQCNDAFSAIKVAGALAEAFGCGVNDLPLSMILSWFEQKAVVILLSLLHLGIQDIRLGPTLPAFITPPVLDVLVEKFNIAPIKTPEEDLAAILGS